MRRRHLYVLMFGLPALLAALLVSFAAFGAAAGFLWLFAYGDDSWPPSAERVLIGLFVLTTIGAWLLLLRAAYVAGRRAETSEALDRRHLLGAVLATAGLPLIALVHQWSVGNIGARSDARACMEFCSAKGFSASAMPPRDSGAQTCGCLDARGREAITVPMAEVRKR